MTEPMSALRSVMDVATVMSRKQEMMRVFVNRSARMKAHTRTGAQRMRRCCSLGEWLWDTHIMPNLKLMSLGLQLKYYIFIGLFVTCTVVYVALAPLSAVFVLFPG